MQVVVSSKMVCRLLHSNTLWKNVSSFPHRFCGLCFLLQNTIQNQTENQQYQRRCKHHNWVTYFATWWRKKRKVVIVRNADRSGGGDRLALFFIFLKKTSFLNIILYKVILYSIKLIKIVFMYTNTTTKEACSFMRVPSHAST